MTNLKALSKVFLALACLLFYSASNPALAQNTTNPWTGTDYTDIADLADWWLQQGGSIDSYFYSEGYTTGSDGSLGNENVCIRDDVNKVYVGRSDVCVDRQMDETYSYIQIDKMDWSMGFPEDIVLQTGDLIGDTPQYWDGCYQIASSPSWGGTSGGQCPNINSATNQINFGYIQQTLTNTAAINQALKEAGVEVTGYTYSWLVKNADANYEDMNNPNSVDPFSVTVSIKDSNGQTVFSKTYDYSYWIDNWTRFSGTEEFKNPLDGTNLSELELSITGKDIGYWAGWYGPEFNEASVKLNYRVKANPVDTTAEDALFNSMCTADPLYDINCPGYNDAMMAQINSSNSIETMTSTEPTLTTTDNTGTNPVAEVAGAADITGTTTASTGSSNTGTTDPVTEATGTPDPVTDATEETTAVEEAVAEATEETAVVEETAVAEATEEKTATEEVASAEPSAAEEKKSTGLNANQLNALNAASAVANSAVGSASDAASASAGVGLDANGGVGAALTSVDPTGSTNAMGGMTGSQDMGSSGTGDSTGTTLAQDSSTTAGSFDNPGINNEGNNGLDAQSTGEVSAPGADTTDVAGGSSTTGIGYTDSAGIGDATGESSIAGLNQTEDSNTTGQNTSDGFDVSSVEQSVVDQSAEQAELANTQLESSVDTTATDNALDAAETAAQASFNQTFAPGNPIDELIKEMTAAIIQAAVDDANEVAAESAEESFEDQNAKEDALVEAAKNGSDDEDAQAALLGYNPKIRAYQQEQVYAGKDIYSNQGMYEDQKTYDNPNARLFNGASDALHREMVRQQYSLGN